MSASTTMPQFSNCERRAGRRLHRLAVDAYSLLTAAQLEDPQRDLARSYSELRELATNPTAPRARRLAAEHDGVLDPRAVALASLAAVRSLGMHPYPVQLLAATALGDRHLVEMATGEGKTLTCAIAAAARAVSGRVHVATANDYLAARDAESMRPLFEALGLTVASVTKRDTDESRRTSYLCDVVYGTVQQFGFDHIIDLTAKSSGALLHPQQRYAIIVDEADSLLLDEATTSLILSGPAPEGATVDHDHYARIAAQLRSEDVYVDKATGLAAFTEEGYETAAALMSRESVVDDPIAYAALLTALTARFVYEPGKHYLLVDPSDISPSGDPYGHSVVLIDEHTGRITADRRLQFGLHDALEARVRLDGGNAPSTTASVTTATITVPSFIALYPFVSGLSGTLVTDADELSATYGTPVVGVPTHRENNRKDNELAVYATQSDKWASILGLVAERHSSGQPILIGCADVNETEVCSALLTDAGIPHQLLNAREHEREAELITLAGLPGTVTVATTMAGRGVDISLGGTEPSVDRDEERTIWQTRRDAVISSGGLLVVATTLFSSRRVDAQLRGRSGRQGEPGETYQFASLEDEIAKTFGANLLAGTAQAALSRNASDDAHQAVPGVSGLLVRAQRRQETLAAATRRQLLEYDAPYNSQRDAFTHLRNHVLESDWRQIAALVSSDTVRTTFGRDTQAREKPLATLEQVFPGSAIDDTMSIEDAETKLSHALLERLQSSRAPLDESGSHEGVDVEAVWSGIVRSVVLSVMDRTWGAHLENIVALRADSTLAGYRQQDARDSFALLAADAWVELRTDIALQSVRRLGGLSIKKNVEA